MSKIGNYALEIQEQANELGFGTIQQALDAGYEVIEDTLVKVDEETKAHQAWLKEKEDLLIRLEDLRSAFNPEENPYSSATLDKAINFIKGVHYE